MALISDLVVRISANTKGLTSGVNYAHKSIGAVAKTAKTTVDVVSRLDTLSATNLSKEMHTVAQEVKSLHTAADAAIPQVDRLRQKVTYAAAATGVAATGMRVLLGATSATAAMTQHFTHRLERLFLTLSALKATLRPVATALGLIATGVQTVLWPITTLAKILYTVARPFLSIVIAIAAFRLSMRALGVQLGWLKALLAMLPLRVKLLLGMFLAAGAAATVFGTAGRIAARAMSLLLIPIVAIRSPMTALKMLGAQVAGGLIGLTRASAKAVTAIRSIASASSQAVRSGLGKLKDGIKGAASSMSGMFSVDGATKVVKLAAASATLAMQMKVLTGSADKAAEVMSRLDQFAADTPFQKLDIAESARQLLAFGSSSETVFDELRVLGDIAAGTGIPLSELADIYGKNQVQGRLFGEDINQLQSRGIPIVAELAKQFGVSESEIKNLVEQGKVGFPEMQKALVAMTATGAKFGGMMKELSTTTEGKFSTLLDKLTLMGTSIGEAVIPQVEALMTMIDDMLTRAASLSDMFTPLVTGATNGFEFIWNSLQDLLTVGAVIAFNFSDIFRAMFEELPKFAKYAFEWITTNAGTIVGNIGVAIQNVFNEIVGFFQQLVEDIKYLTGVSAEYKTIAPTEVKQFAALTQIPIPELGDTASGIIEQVNTALSGLRAERAANAAAQVQKKAEETAKPFPFAPGNTDGKGDKINGTEPKFAGALQKGSAEAFSAIAQNMRGDDQVKATNSVNNTLKKDVAKPLQKLASAQSNAVFVGAIS